MADPVRDHALDENGDMAFVNGDRALVAGLAAVQQAVKVKCRVFLSEVLLDQSLGVDYVNQILIKSPDPLVVRELIKDRIASVADVTDVVGANLTIDRATRTGSITYRIRTVYSTSTVDGSVTVPG